MTKEEMVSKAEAKPAKPYKRKVKAKKPVWYDPEDRKPGPKKQERNENKTPKLRGSITPGTILILLSGRFRGKRVVFLKQLKSGTLLITGPFEVNGVPLRRVNQRYVIATSVKVDITGVTIPVKDDTYFAREDQPKKTSEDRFFDHASKGPIVPDRKKQDQKTVDTGVVAAISSEPLLKAYLSTKFSLKNGDRPHEMLF